MRYFKYSLLFVLVFSIISSAQFKRKPIFIETNYVVDGESASTFISYKIPYTNLVFVKDKDKYHSGITFTIEIYAENGEDLITREFTHKSISATSYKDTENPDIFLNDILNVNLTPGIYLVQPLVDLDNTNRSVKLETFQLYIEPANAEKISPVIVLKNESKCDGSPYELVNHENRVPFGDKKSTLLLSIPEDLSSQPELIITTSSDTQDSISSILFPGKSFSISNCDSIISVQKVDKDNFTFLEITEPIYKLEEGDYSLKINTQNSTYTADFVVEWIDRPFSVSDPKFAIELLKIAYGDETALELLRKDEDNYYTELVNFWKKYDPIKETVFNELMNEYYQRADYSIRNFSSLDKRNGAETDRGKTFIKFGDPDSIKRGSNEKDKITEIWYYGNLGKTFVFVDESGLGNFILK